jgi:hypothetical protein
MAALLVGNRALHHFSQMNGVSDRTGGNDGPGDAGCIRFLPESANNGGQLTDRRPVDEICCISVGCLVHPHVEGPPVPK